MFNDKYGLTKTVLENRKTQTRRICAFGSKTYEKAYRNLLSNYKDGACFNNELLKCSLYKVGEEVAIAQSYFDCGYTVSARRLEIIPGHTAQFSDGSAGWNNKMFVRAVLMPRRIKITNIRIEHLQDISEDDCLKEGIGKRGDTLLEFFVYGEDDILFDTPQRAFASLIDKTCGKGTWQNNPWVFVYDFELIK